MSHHGDPAEEEEVLVVEEPERPEKGEHRVVKAPRVPTHEERNAHEAIHIPHEEWCETCMAGRGRNKPHRKRKRKRKVPGEHRKLVIPLTDRWTMMLP